LPPAGIPSLPYVIAEKFGERNNGFGNYSVDNVPGIYVSIKQPSEYIRFDAVPVNTSFKPDTYGFDLTVNYPTISPSLPPQENILGVPSYGLITSFVGPNITSLGSPGPYPFVELGFRYGYTQAYWDFATLMLGDGTLYQVPNADYRILVRALKWGFDSKNARGYESWLSPIVRLNVTGNNPFLNPPNIAFPPGFPGLRRTSKRLE
jgi:hypothetical protein